MLETRKLRGSKNLRDGTKNTPKLIVAANMYTLFVQDVQKNALNVAWHLDFHLAPMFFGCPEAAP